MSFILSALKKVENKRNLGSVPELSAIQIQGFERPYSRRYRIAVLTSIVGIAVVAIFATLWVYKPSLEQPFAEQETKSAMVAPQPRQAAVMPLSPQQSNPNVAPVTVIPPNPMAPVAPIYYPSQQPTINNNVAASPPAYTPSPQLYQNPIDAPDWEPLPVGIVNYEELPSGLRQRIPNIKLSAHIHSDIRPQARKVIINGVSLREGQRLSDDLTVHQINSDGAVMDYQGTLFLLSKTSIFN